MATCARSIAPNRRWQANLAKYLPLWKLAVPAEFETFHPWDFSKFGRGERFVNKPLPRRSSTKYSRKSNAGASISTSRIANPETLSYPA